jgi:hypothetical protein
MFVCVTPPRGPEVCSSQPILAGQSFREGDSILYQLAQTCGPANAVTDTLKYPGDRAPYEPARLA